MIEPIVASKRKAARAAHRRDHEVGTLYVSNEESIDSVKKRRVKAAPKAEDYASFVAEIDEGEIDPFAVPSYGETSLTHDDEEYIKGLVSEDDSPETPKRAPKKKVKRDPEKRDPAKRDAQKREPAKKAPEKIDAPEPLDAPEKNDAPEANEAAVEKKRPKRAERKKVEPKVETPVETKEPERVVEESAAPKRVDKKTSFFSKIKRAVSSTVAPVALDSGQDAKLSEEQLTALAQNAQKVLDAVGSESKASLAQKDRTPRKRRSEPPSRQLGARLASQRRRSEERRRRERDRQRARGSAQACRQRTPPQTRRRAELRPRARLYARDSDRRSEFRPRGRRR